MTATASMLDARRAKAREAFRASGVPNRRVEEWKYTDLLNSLDGAGANESDAASGGVRNVLTQGVDLFELGEDRIVPKWVLNHFDKPEHRSGMADAALGFARNMIALRVPAGLKVEQPLELERVGSGHGYLLLLVEDGASVTLLDTQVIGATTRLANTLIEINIAPHASVEHVRSASLLKTARVVETIDVKVAADASYRGRFVDFGAKISRAELHITLEGEGAQAHLSGVSVLNGAHADVTVHMDHAVGNTQSTQLFKYVAGGHSRGVYQGKVTVREGANGSDSRQAAKGLLLEDRAEIDLKPELEILADDVKCAHGAAVGDLDAESLFYLRSRGLPEAEARALLMRAFLGDAVEQIADEAIRASVWQAVEAALEAVS